MRKTFNQAINSIIRSSIPLSSDIIPLEKSVGRILRENIYSSFDIPAFNKSAMDGYAVKTTDIKSIPTKLRVIGLIQAGDIFANKVKTNESAKIMTGAATPGGTDSVVMVENTKEKNGFVTILKSPKKGENIYKKGIDIKKGQKVLNSGKIISNSDIPLLASLGRRNIKVSKKPRMRRLKGMLSGQVIFFPLFLKF